MKLWLDAQLPPVLASELRLQTGLDVVHVAELGLVTAKDEAIYAAAKDADVVLLTKDADFPRLLERLGPPPPASSGSPLAIAATASSSRPCCAAGLGCSRTSNVANHWSRSAARPELQVERFTIVVLA